GRARFFGIATGLIGVPFADIFRYRNNIANPTPVEEGSFCFLAEFAISLACLVREPPRHEPAETGTATASGSLAARRCCVRRKSSASACPAGETCRTTSPAPENARQNSCRSLPPRRRGASDGTAASRTPKRAGQSPSASWRE